MKQDDPRAGNPQAELKLVMKAVLDAIESYNQANQFPIRTVGFWTRDLWINRMDASMAGEIIRSVYEEHYSQTKVLKRWMRPQYYTVQWGKKSLA